MSRPRSGSGSPPLPPPASTSRLGLRNVELLSPAASRRASQSGSPQHEHFQNRASAATTNHTLSIASYYYRNPGDSYEEANNRARRPFASSSSSLASSPSATDTHWQSHTNTSQQPTSSPHGRLSPVPLDEAEESPQRPFGAADAGPSSRAHDFFADWSDAFHVGGGSHLRESSSDGPSQMPRVLTHPFSTSTDNEEIPQASLRLVPSTNPQERRQAGGHSRIVSSATEGDVGVHMPYNASAGGAESMKSLDMGFRQTGPQPGSAASLPETPMHEIFSAHGADMEGDESEIAGLTTNSANVAWVASGQQFVQSPEERLDGSSPGVERQRSGYFDLEADSANAYEGTMQDAQGQHTRPSSSADMYNSFSAPQAKDGILRARNGLSKVGKSIRRISRRVINVDGNERPDREGRIRLPDRDDDSSDSEGAIGVEEMPSRPAIEGLRGKSLGIFGPTSRTRQTLASFMSQWWVEPVLLCAIIFHVVLLIYQSAYNVFERPRVPGYFDYWFDHALLAVFCVYTVEVIARIIVSGLIINPPPPDYKIAEDRASISSQARSNIASRVPEAPHRPSAMRSNTKDTFAALGDALKTKTTTALNPQSSLQLGRTVSPNHQFPPRIVKSDHLEPEGPPSGDRNQRPEGRRDTQNGELNPMTLLNDKTARFLQKSRLAPFAHAIVQQRAQAVDYAYLRHSWNRVDFIAVVSFWVTFTLAVLHQEDVSTHHIFIFRALSVLRVSRLLTATRGTSVILRSLKTAGPLLVNVASFTIFSMLLFSIIGVQSFEGNYKRSCLWVGDLQQGIDYAPGVNYSLSQMCGGHYDAVTGQQQVPLNAEHRPLHLSIKGYICPRGQICMEDENPENGTESFDNILEALLQVVIIISLNGWSDIMYNMIDADYFASCLYFIIGVIIMNFWMANLFVAVITNTFATISAETKQSAFAAERIEPPKPLVVEVAEPSGLARHRQRAASVFKRLWSYTKYLWLALIVADLGVQASQASYRLTKENDRLSATELYMTIAFDAEILLRFFSYLLDNDWRSFFVNKRNRFDLFLAIITTIVQVPPIRNSGAYAWLTAFQLARFYRVIAAVPRMEALLVRVFGSMAGLFNMILFLLMMVGLASLFAVQLFRGDIQQEADGESIEMNFKTIYNSFLAMYQIFSSENWTTVLYNALTAEGQYRQAVIAGIFLCAWFLFANFIVLQMFIAVIAENFGVAENQKRAQQLEVYLRNLEKPQHSLFARFVHYVSPYRWLREHNAAMVGDLPESKSNKKLAERTLDKLDEKNRNRRNLHGIISPSSADHALKLIRRVLRLDRPDENVPLDTVRARQLRMSLSGASVLSPTRGHSMYENSSTALLVPSTEENARVFARDRQLTRMRTGLGLVREEAPNQAEVDAMHLNRWKDDPRMAQARLINTHPSYEKSLWLFSNTSRFRRVCQSFVPCSHGERLFGRKTSPFRLKIYQALIFSTVAASVIIAGVATPKYRRDWYAENGLRRASWFSLSEIALSIIFIFEFFVKVVADGFAFTPNAYLLSPWNALDLFVLMTLVINVSTELAVIGGVSRFTRALKAFRALRLINLSDLMRRTFSGLIAGGGRFLDASVLAILYIVPFAIWGQNLFSGLLYSCTDTSSGISTKSDCIGEYSASPSEWSFLAPRAWQNPNDGSVYSFDDFRSSLLILFEIVSLEGWIDVMTTAMSVTGLNQQLEPDARQVNALFFLIYNLIGAVFVLTLFVAVIIESFQSFSGAAYLTTQQRQWIDLKRLIARQRPSKRPKVRPTDPVRRRCYDISTNKNSWWSRLMTTLYLASLITLATQTYGDRMKSERVRDVLYIIVACFYAADICIRLAGLGWTAYRQNAWNIFDLIVVTGTLATSIPLLGRNENNVVNLQVQKIFLVAVAFKLVQKNNALNQLFKTAISSLPSIASLFLLWLTMFLIWGIMLVEVFGLTAWGANESYSKNFSSLLRSLVFLSMMSTGEGWNQYMHDFTLSPPLCTPAANYLDTDCGSEGWAYFLFVGWNVISMYIFLNMFTGTVVENFSYVFQLGGKPTLSREQVRNFKHAWAEYDQKRTGYMPKDKLVPFFNRLDGNLELRVHPVGTEIQALKDKAMAAAGTGMPRENSSMMPSSPLREAAHRLRARSPKKAHDSKSHYLWPPVPQDGMVINGLSISSLNQQLNALDYTEIRRRRHRFERIYHEAVLLSERPHNREKGGVSFSDMMLLVAHYKLIDDEHALSLEELMERRELLQHVEDRIETERVRGALRQIWLRRRFLAVREEHHRMSMQRRQERSQDHRRSPQSSTVPEITINEPRIHSAEDGPHTPRMRGRPSLSLNLEGLSSHQGRTQHGVWDDTSLSPSRTRVLREADGDSDKPSIHLTTTNDDSSGSDDDDDDRDGGRRESDQTLHSRSGDRDPFALQLSPSTSLQELERRASPVIQEIDRSAWGALARRLSSEGAASARYGSSSSRRSSIGRRSLMSMGSENAPEAATAAAAVGSASGDSTTSPVRHRSTNSVAGSNSLGADATHFTSPRTEEMRQVHSNIAGTDASVSSPSTSSLRSRFTGPTS